MLQRLHEFSLHAMGAHRIFFNGGGGAKPLGLATMAYFSARQRRHFKFRFIFSRKLHTTSSFSHSSGGGRPSLSPPPGADASRRALHFLPRRATALTQAPAADQAMGDAAAPSKEPVSGKEPAPSKEAVPSKEPTNVQAPVPGQASALSQPSVPSLAADGASRASSVAFTGSSSDEPFYD